MSTTIPDAALTQHIIALGKTGSGKSSALRVLVERMLNEKRRVCILDPKGDWWGLKLSASGKSAGFPVVIFGGEHADVPINQHAGSHIAELVATGNRPCIIDLGGWGVGERTRFFIDYAAALFRTNKSPLWQVIDEVHNFAPQGKIMDPDAGRMLHWSNRLASEGRGKNVVMLAASQRPQKVHKDFVTSCETLIAMRVIHPLDRAAIKDWIDGCPDREKGGEVLGSLASMKRGEAWVWSPEIGFGPAQLTFPMFKTYDSFSPQTETGAANLRGWAEVDLEDVKTKLESVVKEAKANDPKELRKKIAELEKQLKDRPTEQKVVEREKVVEVPALKEAEIVRLEKTVEKIEAQGRQSIEQGEKLLADARQFWAALAAIRKPAAPAPVRAVARPAIAPVQRRSIVSAAPRSSGVATDTSLAKGERATLTAVAQYPDGADREQLSVLTGYKRSSRDTYLQRLREKGLIEQYGDIIRPTTEGIAALGDDFEPLPTGAALREHWLQRLTGGEQKILEVLIEHYPNGIARADLDEPTGYQRSSRDTYLQRLSARKLVENVGRGEVKASDILFD